MNKASSSFYSNYLNFSGRATRSEFWWTMLSFFGAGVIVCIVMVAGVVLVQGYLIIIGLVLLLVLIFGNIVGLYSLRIRRLHDTNRSGWWLLLDFVPVFGGIILFIFYVMPSEGPNNYGPHPSTKLDDGTQGVSGEGRRFCSNCGVVLRDDVSFCPSCGVQI